jgi:hypothetical protein
VVKFAFKKTREQKYMAIETQAGTPSGGMLYQPSVDSLAAHILRDIVESTSSRLKAARVNRDEKIVTYFDRMSKDRSVTKGQLLSTKLVAAVLTFPIEMVNDSLIIDLAMCSGLTSLLGVLETQLTTFREPTTNFKIFEKNAVRRLREVWQKDPHSTIILSQIVEKVIGTSFESLAVFCIYVHFLAQENARSLRKFRTRDSRASRDKKST